MDQVYLPKNRSGLATGSYVVVRDLELKKESVKPFFYNLKELEPIKVKVIDDTFKIINSFVRNDNIIITGSFLEKGFIFNDVDVLIITKEKADLSAVEEALRNNLGMKFHLILIKNKELIKGLETDPLYGVMLSKSVARNRFVYNIKSKINYKLLDLHLLKSELLVLNFDFLTGNQKYEMIRNAVAILLFIEKKETNKKMIDVNIKKLFKVDVEDIKNNMIKDKKSFSEKYKEFYKNLFSRILNGVKNESK